MKNIIFLILISLFLSSCGGSSSPPYSPPAPATPVPPPLDYVVQEFNGDTTCTEPRMVPENTRLRFSEGAHLIKGDGCLINFASIGLEKPESNIAVFSGFSPGDIVWTGTSYPAIISASLWGNADLSDKLLNAFAATKDKRVTIKAFPGTFGKSFTYPAWHDVYFTSGRYKNTIDLQDGIQFWIESNTTVYGDGKDRTILEGSSRPGRNTRMFAGSGFKEGPFAGYNEKITIRDLAIEGNPTQVFFDNGPTTVQFGNCTDCHAIRVRLKEIHAYGIYIGGFHNLGFTAKDSSIEYCEFDHVIGQNSGALNGINIKIVHNKYWNLGKLATDPLSNAVDFEPNVEDEITQNITVCDNEIDGTGAKQYWNGIIVQIGGSRLPIDGGEVCRNKVTGEGLLNAIAVAGAKNIAVHDNNISYAMQSGLYLNNNSGLNVANNILFNVAPGGLYAVRVENTTGCKFSGNSVTKDNPGSDDRFVEFGTSGNNVYSGNKRGDVVLLNGSTETDHQ